MANTTIYPFGPNGEQSEGVWSERITAMQGTIDRLAPLAFRSEPAIPFYTIESPITTQNYDTEVQLFDEPKSFTILGVASFNNYNWSSTDRVQSLIGLSTDNYFRLGAIYGCSAYNNNASLGTENYYCALIMNYTSSGKRATSIGSRVNGTQTLRFAITYDHTTRKIYGQASTENKTHWWIVPGDLESEDTLKLLIGGATGTISTLEIYDKVLDWMTIDNFIIGG